MVSLRSSGLEESNRSFPPEQSHWSQGKKNHQRIWVTGSFCSQNQNCSVGGETCVTAGNRLWQPCTGNRVSSGYCGYHSTAATDKVAAGPVNKCACIHTCTRMCKYYHPHHKEPCGSSVAKSRPTLCDPMGWNTPSLSFTVSWSLLKLISAESVMPSKHLILCGPLFLLPLIFPSIGVFSNEMVLRIRWPKYWSFSFSISPSNEYSGLISFRIDWFNLLTVQGTLKSLLQHTHSSKAFNPSVLSSGRW